MLRKIFQSFSLLLIFTVVIFETAEAAKATSSLTNIHVRDLDEDTLRISINCKGNVKEEDIKTSVEGKLLLIDIDNTTPGRVNNSIASNRNDATNSVKKISVNEQELNRTRIKALMTIPIDEDSYSVKIQSNGKIIIDVAKPTVEKKSSGKIDLARYYELRKPTGTSSSREYTPAENYTVNNPNGRIIVIDAGHGGSDSGAVGPSGVSEKSVTLAVALKVERLLLEEGINVIMTRRTDIDVASASASNAAELQSRVNYSPPNTDAFISIHCNAFSSPSSRGMETYYYSGSPQSRRLAELLNEELLRYGGLSNRGVKTANFYVLKHSNCPASLIELAFITNYEEERLLADDSYQNSLAQAISNAVKRFLNEQGGYVVTNNNPVEVAGNFEEHDEINSVVRLHDRKKDSSYEIGKKFYKDDFSAEEATSIK